MSSNVEDEKDDSGIEQDNHWIYIRIAIEDLHLQKVLKFNLDDRVWIAKQKVLQVLFQELNESFNYGLYLPPSNGRAGKFLDESRSLREYPLTGPVSHLEFKYKRRISKSINSIPKNIQIKMNVKKFVEAIRSNQIGKVNRYLEKGFDPNIHLSDSETPLSLASIELINPREMLMTLVNGGAHLDFRTRFGGLTALHWAAIHQRKESILTLLELGLSANVLDAKNLTPLFHLIINTKENDSFGNSSDCCLILLEDHSIVDHRDDSFSTELHHCCRLGLVQHVEHLIFYRADLNAQDQCGNTPLHICAKMNQLNCARILLYRGSDRTRVNQLNQTAYDLSILSSNIEIASLIKRSSDEPIHQFEEIPLKNPRRRSIYFQEEQNSTRRRCSSNCTTFSLLTHRSQSMPKLNSIVSQQQQQQIHSSSRSSSPKSSSVNSDQGFGGSESNSHFSSNSQKFLTNDSFSSQRKRLYFVTPGRKCLCIKTYRTNSPGDLTLNKGDIIEIVSVADDGYLEGKLNEYQGWFPSDHVQEINIIKNGETKHDDRILISRDALSALMMNNENSSSRTIVLQRGKKGFGFVLRGSRVAGKLFHPTSSFPALQFLDSIEKGSNADKAGLKQNDYVLEINGVNVVSMPHEECVQLIKKSGDTLALKVVTATSTSTMSQSQYQHQSIPSTHSTQSLPYRRKAPLRPDLEQSSNVARLTTKSSIRSSPFHYLFDRSETNLHLLFDDPDRTLLSECEDQNGINSSEETSSLSKTNEENVTNRTKPIVPERDSSLYELMTTNQGYQTFRSLSRNSCQMICTTSNSNQRNEIRRNSNSSSNEADEESSLSSLNSNQFISSTFDCQHEELLTNSSITLINTNLSTFKTTMTNGNPSRPNDVKRRSNCRKQPSNIVQMNNSNPSSSNVVPPPPPPPLPTDFDQKKISDEEKTSSSSSSGDFQNEIEKAKNRLKKIEKEKNENEEFQSTSSSTSSMNENLHQNPSGFPPPPSPTTLRRSTPSIVDPRLDCNFSAVIAKRAAESKARRHENPFPFEFNSTGLPPSTTFFNNCVTTNRIQQHLPNSNYSHQQQQRFSATANQLLENLKRRGATTTPTSVRY